MKLRPPSLSLSWVGVAELYAESLCVLRARVAAAAFDGAAGGGGAGALPATPPPESLVLHSRHAVS